MTRDWSNLNNDILRLIASKVRTLEDFTRLAAVCSNWFSVLIKKQQGSIFCRPQLPWLILPCDHENGRSRSQSQSRRCFSIMENKIHHLYFPQAHGKKCVGSSHGWLIMVEDVSPAIFMLNPLTKQRIELPPVTTMPDILGFNTEDVGREYIYQDISCGAIYSWSLKDIEEFFTAKIILSNNPEKEDCIAVALCGMLSRLVFCRIGDNKWTQVEHDLKHPQNDVVYSKGKFYFVNCNGRVCVFDVENPQATIFHEPPCCINICHAMYLAIDTSGVLLLISRCVEIYDSLSEAQHENVNNDLNDGNDFDNNVVKDDADINDDEKNNAEDDGDAGHDSYNDDDEEQNENHPSNRFYRTEEFNVYKLEEEKNEWNKVRDIGENVVFIGANQSSCYSTIDFPECNRNSIYFTDDNIDWQGGIHEGHDVGIYNIGDGSIQKVSCFKEDMPLMTILPRPVWFTPSISSSNTVLTLCFSS